MRKDCSSILGTSVSYNFSLLANHAKETMRHRRHLTRIKTAKHEAHFGAAHEIRLNWFGAIPMNKCLFP